MRPLHTISITPQNLMHSGTAARQSADSNSWFTVSNFLDDRARVCWHELEAPKILPLGTYSPITNSCSGGQSWALGGLANVP